MKQPIKTEKHVFKEGNRNHVLHWDSEGEHCSNPNCEINKSKRTNVKRTEDCYMSRKRCFNDDDCTKCPIWKKDQKSNEGD